MLRPVPGPDKAINSERMARLSATGAALFVCSCSASLSLCITCRLARRLFLEGERTARIGRGQARVRAIRVSYDSVRGARGQITSGGGFAEASARRDRTLKLFMTTDVSR